MKKIIALTFLIFTLSIGVCFAQTYEVIYNPSVDNGGANIRDQYDKSQIVEYVDIGAKLEYLGSKIGNRLLVKTGSGKTGTVYAPLVKPSTAAKAPAVSAPSDPIAPAPAGGDSPDSNLSDDDVSDILGDEQGDAAGDEEDEWEDEDF